jgi:hypothetical protein
MSSTESQVRVLTELGRLSTDLKGMIECKSTRVLAHADNTALISWPLSDVTRVHNELAIAAKQIGSEFKTYTSRRAAKSIHNIICMRGTIQAVYLGPNQSKRTAWTNKDKAV